MIFQLKSALRYRRGEIGEIGDLRHSQPCDDVIVPDLCIQFLDGRKLRPGAEYFIWFHFPNPEPVEIKAQLAFPAAGLASPNRPETLASTLGLTPLLRRDGAECVPALRGRVWQCRCPCPGKPAWNRPDDLAIEEFSQMSSQ